MNEAIKKIKHLVRSDGQFIVITEDGGLYQGIYLDRILKDITEKEIKK